MNINQTHPIPRVPISDELVEEYRRRRNRQRAWFWRIAIPLLGLCWIMTILAILEVSA